MHKIVYNVHYAEQPYSNSNIETFFHTQALSCCVVMPMSNLVLVGSWDNNL